MGPIGKGSESSAMQLLDIISDPKKMKSRLEEFARVEERAILAEREASEKVIESKARCTQQVEEARLKADGIILEAEAKAEGILADVQEAQARLNEDITAFRNESNEEKSTLREMGEEISSRQKALDVREGLMDKREAKLLKSEEEVERKLKIISQL